MLCDQTTREPSRTTARTPMRRESLPLTMPSAVGHDSSRVLSQPGNSISMRARRVPVRLSIPSTRLASGPKVAFRSIDTPPPASYDEPVLAPAGPPHPAPAWLAAAARVHPGEPRGRGAIQCALRPRVDLLEELGQRLRPPAPAVADLREVRAEDEARAGLAHVGRLRGGPGLLGGQASRRALLAILTRSFTCPFLHRTGFFFFFFFFFATETASVPDGAEEVAAGAPAASRPRTSTATAKARNMERR